MANSKKEGKMEFVSRFFQDAPQSYFLFGPRGTGKSTWLHRYLPSATFIDLLSPEVFRVYSARPERLKEVVAALPVGSTIVIDEIQKLPGLLDVVHLLLETNRMIRFILTGSSARKLKRSGVDLLAGRALVKALHPFMAAELGNEFSLAQALQTGMVPLVANALSPDETLKSYIALYLREEVQMEGLIRNIGSFSRFMESISFSHGAVLNITDVARDCEVNRKTVEGYLAVLEDLLLSFRVPVFTKRAKRHLSTHPKFYFFDAGVFRSLRPAGPLDAPTEIDGAALEGLVAQHLRAWIEYSGNRAEMYFWRTKSGNEVDFVVYGPDTFCAVEVKNSAKVHAKSVKSLVSFKKDYPQSDAVLLYRGNERLKINNVTCLPCAEFLRNLSPHRPFPITPDHNK